MATKPLFCDDCGTRNTPDSKYCKECGAKISFAYDTLPLSEHDRVDDAQQQERLTQFLDMAFWHTEAGNTDAAIRACHSALEIQPNSTTALSLLGCLCEKKGDNAQAIEHFERVLELNPHSDADRAKLQQLRDGIHAPPVPNAPLPRQSWRERLRPSLAALAEKWADRPQPDFTVMPVRPTPALAAGAVAVLVLAGGLFMIKPPPPTAASTPRLPSPANQNDVNHSAFATASAQDAAPASNPLPAPIVLAPSHGGTPLLPPGSVTPNFAAPRSDPFEGAPPTNVRSYLPMGEPLRLRKRAARARVAGHSAGGGLHALPPLNYSLVAVPPAGDGPLPPAPVKVPASVREASSAASADGIARHTVVVQHFSNSPSEFAQMGARPAATTSSDDTPASSAPSHIEITIDRSPDSGGGGASGDNTPAGETYQQTAFGLQQQGDYRRARATYEKAIHAYQSQISAGRDPEAARRGLEACQTGLQICQQNQ